VTETLPTTAREVVDNWLAHVEPYPQYHGWLTTKRWDVRRLKQRIGGDGTFVRGEVGDLVLVFPKEHRGWLTSWPEYDTVYVPRVEWNVAIPAAAYADEPIYIGRREAAAA
jgi:hypothetical protein